MSLESIFLQGIWCESVDPTLPVSGMTSKKNLNDAHCLEPGKRVEANNGYVGHAVKIKCPNNDCNPEENLVMQARIRSCHKTFNAYPKFWGILGQEYRHNILKHGSVFYACAVISQLTIEYDKPLFAIQYSN